MTKICHITTVHKRYDTRIFQKQCRSLADAGHDVTLLCVDDQEDENKDGVNIESVTLKTRHTIIRILKAPYAIYKLALAKDAEIYQIHDPELLPVGLKLKRLGKKVIYDSHEDFPNQILEKEWIPKFLRKLLSYMAVKYLHWALKKFDAVLTVTPHIVEKLKKITDNVFMVTNFPIYEEGIENILLSGYLARQNKLCYSGSVYTYSNQDKIIEAISTMNDIEYIIVGSIDNRLYSDLKETEGWTKVNYIGKLAKEQLYAVYQDVTIGIVLFDYSGNLGNNLGTLGNNKLFEYMFFGLPVICTDFILWKHIIDKYKCGLYVNPKNIEEIKNAVKYLVEHKTEAYQMGQNGRRAVYEEYNWKSQEKIYFKVIDKIILQN